QMKPMTILCTVQPEKGKFSSDFNEAKTTLSSQSRKFGKMMVRAGADYLGTVSRRSGLLAVSSAKSLFESRRLPNRVTAARGGYKAGSVRKNAFVNSANSQQAVLLGEAVPKMTYEDAA